MWRFGGIAVLGAKYNCFHVEPVIQSYYPSSAIQLYLFQCSVTNICALGTCNGAKYITYAEMHAQIDLGWMKNSKVGNGSNGLRMFILDNNIYFIV